MIDTETAGGQIPLPFTLFDRFDFDLYLPGPNREAVEQLQRMVMEGGIPFIFLWGGPGTGKSHLLQAVCTLAADHGHATAYIPLKNTSELAPPMLEGMERVEFLCIDDLDRVVGEGDWELALFHLFNRLRDAGHGLVISAAHNPRHIDIRLPDLKSRMEWGLGYHLQPLSDRECLTALQQRALARGFTLPDEVADYLVKRIARDTHTMFDLLDRLDNATLVAKKRLTIPFVREQLEGRK